MLKIGITGHRKLLNHLEVEKHICLSLRFFKDLDNDIKGITALASGADTIFAKEIQLMGGDLDIILPFARDEYSKDFVDDAKKEFDSFLKQYSGEIEINQDAVPQTKKDRDEAYLAVGMRIVDESDIILAVWDNEVSNGQGGTADVVAYAKSMGKEVHVIKGVRKENPANDPVEELFEKLDTQAIKYKNMFFEPIWLTGLITGVLAVGCFAFIISFLHHAHPQDDAHAGDAKFILGILEVIFLTCSFVLLTFANRWKYKFLDKRRKAEFLRSLIWFKNAKIQIFPLTNTYDDKDITDDLREILTIEKQMADNNIIATGNLSNAKRMLWCLADEQVAYHQKMRVGRFTDNMHRIHIYANVIKIIFVLTVICKFVIEMIEHFYNKNMPGWMMDQFLPICFFMVIVLPSLYATLEGIKYFGDWKRKIQSSKPILAKLKEIKKNIQKITNEDELVAEARMLRNALDLENIVWLNEYSILEIEAKV